MKSASLKEIKLELEEKKQEEILELCLRLCRFKKEIKELLTYLLFEAHDESGYIEQVKELVDEKFEQINRKSPYFVKKSIRSILAQCRKYIRYSKSKETEVEILLYFCEKIKEFRPSLRHNRKVWSLYERLLEQLRTKINALHEDLQYDYKLELEGLAT